MLSVISRKPASPNDFNYFMDHAFFSACRLYQELSASIGAGKINKMHVDALSAIMLHNSLFKFNVAVGDYKKPLCMEQHPLAFLLMLFQFIPLLILIVFTFASFFITKPVLLITSRSIVTRS